MTECRQQKFEFQDHFGRKVEADFTGGHLSSDGGALLLREAGKAAGVIRQLSKCFRDGRDQRYVEHGLEELIGQRVHSLILGYEDLNDADSLRHDPVLSLLSGREDVEGGRRSHEADRGKGLAGSSTLNRLELGSLGLDARYRNCLRHIPTATSSLRPGQAPASPGHHGPEKSAF